MERSTGPESDAIREVLRLSRSGDFGSAERRFDETLAASVNPLIHCLFGYECLDHRESEKAVGCFVRAIRIDDRFAPGWGGMGRAFLELQRWDEAEEAFRTRLRIGENANQYVFLSMVLLRKEQYREAIACCERALRMDGGQVDALLNQSRAYSLLGAHGRAISICRDAVDIAPGYHEAYVCLGVALAEAGRVDEASDAFQAAIEIDPDDAAAYREFGLLQRSIGDRELARLYLEAARKIEDEGVGSRKP